MSTQRSFYIRESELDDYQIRILNRKSDKSLIVSGCAGSGKSILALHQAERIELEKKGTCIIIVYTRALQNFITKGLDEHKLENINVVTSYDYFKRYGPNHRKYSYIIIDEVQDFSLKQIDTIRTYAEKAVLMYGDSAQQLYDDNVLDHEPTATLDEIKAKTGFPLETLVFNHRLPKKIARLAEYLNSEEDELEERCKNEGDEKPKIIKFESVDEQLEAIIEFIKNGNLKDVGILCPNNKCAEYAYFFLRDRKINIEARFRFSSQPGEMSSSIDNLDFYSDNPKILTYHSSKGLQFENVFIPECSDEAARKKNALYVAITRSYHRLFIMHSGNLSSVFKGVPCDLYETEIASDNIEDL